MSSPPTVVAIIAAFNEADIIDTVITDLVRQDVQVYFLDDGSTDGTPEIVARHDGRGVIGIERLPPHHAEEERGFAWERILCRKAQLAHELNADWFIHHDADEFRESPWPGSSLRDGIAWVDRLGFNAIDFVCLDFWPDREVFENGHDVRDVFTRYAPAAAYDRVQIRCWKKTASPVDLTASGGHEATFEARRVFPVRFILRHYPIRGQRHGERKVFHERQFLDAERERGWHVQYDAFREGRPFLHDSATLRPYDPDDVRLSLTLRHRGVEELEETLASTQANLEGTSRDLAASNTELETLARELESERQALKVKTTDANRLGADLERTTADLERTTAELGSRTREIESLTGALESKAHDLSQTRTALAQSQVLIERSRRELAALADNVSSLRAHGEKQAADLAQVQSAFESSRAEGQRLQSQMDEARKLISNLQRACDDRGRELEAFRQSLSWRWTEPVRAIYRLLWRTK